MWYDMSNKKSTFIKIKINPEDSFIGDRFYFDKSKKGAISCTGDDNCPVCKLLKSLKNK